MKWRKSFCREQAEREHTVRQRIQKTEATLFPDWIVHYCSTLLISMVMKYCTESIISYTVLYYNKNMLL